MADFYNVHLRKTTDPTVIQKTKLERGMVVKLRYKKDSGVANYIILVLQPRWPNTSIGKLHALSLNVIPISNTLELADNYKEVISESKKVRILDLAKLKIDTSSKLFYTSEIIEDRKLKAAYRTFDLKNIKSITAVNYDWGKYDKVPSVAERERLLEEKKKPNENKL